MQNNAQELDPMMGFELEKDYERKWETICYKKIKKVVNNITDRHIYGKLLVHKDMLDIQSEFSKMKVYCMPYYSSDAKKLILSANPIYKDVYSKGESKRKLKYICDNEDNNGDEIIIGRSYFERIS